jgi:hypothetical protein
MDTKYTLAEKAIRAAYSLGREEGAADALCHARACYLDPVQKILEDYKKEVAEKSKLTTNEKSLLYIYKTPRAEWNLNYSKLKDLVDTGWLEQEDAATFRLTQSGIQKAHELRENG